MLTILGRPQRVCTGLTRRALLQAGPVTLDTLPGELVADWTAKDGRARIQVLPQSGRDDNASLRRFGQAVQAIDPDATGSPISTSASGDSIVEAFLQAGLYSLVAITLLLAPTANAALFAAMLRATPENMRGRVNNTVILAATGLAALAPLTAGLLVQHLSGTWALAVFAAAIGVAAIMSMALPWLRQAEAAAATGESTQLIAE